MTVQRSSSGKHEAQLLRSQRAELELVADPPPHAVGERLEHRSRSSSVDMLCFYNIIGGDSSEEIRDGPEIQGVRRTSPGRCTRCSRRSPIPAQLSHYFTTGGAKGRLETGATVTWDFHDFPGAFPVHVIEVVPDERIVLEWKANESASRAKADDYNTTVTMAFKPVDDGRTLVEIAEEGWHDTPAGAQGELRQLHGLDRRCSPRSRCGSSTASTCARGCTSRPSARRSRHRFAAPARRSPARSARRRTTGRRRQVVVGQVARVGRRERREAGAGGEAWSVPPNVPPGGDDAADPSAVPGDLLRSDATSRARLRPRRRRRPRSGRLRDAALAVGAGGGGRADAEHARAVELAPAEQRVLHRRPRRAARARWPTSPAPRCSARSGRPSTRRGASCQTPSATIVADRRERRPASPGSARGGSLALAPFAGAVAELGLQQRGLGQPQAERSPPSVVSGTHSSTWTHHGGSTASCSDTARTTTSAPMIIVRNAAGPSPTLNAEKSSPQARQRSAKRVQPANSVRAPQRGQRPKRAASAMRGLPFRLVQARRPSEA